MKFYRRKSKYIDRSSQYIGVSTKDIDFAINKNKNRSLPVPVSQHSVKKPRIVDNSGFRSEKGVFIFMLMQLLVLADLQALQRLLMLSLVQLCISFVLLCSSLILLPYMQRLLLSNHIPSEC